MDNEIEKPEYLTSQIMSLGDEIVDMFDELDGPMKHTMFRNNILDAISALKGALEEYDEKYIAAYKGKTSIEIGDNVYFVGVKKTERYDTPGIYDAINKLNLQTRMDALINVLPKNPKFGKGAVYNLMDMTGATDLHSTDESDKVEVKSIPKRLLKGGK